MKYAIVASKWARLSIGIAAAAVGSWLALAGCPASFAADGAQAAAKQAAENMQTYLRDLEKSGGQPDYSKPPASEYLKLIFNTDALAALPAPKAEDLSWLQEWVASSNQVNKRMLMFGLASPSDQQTIGLNLVQRQDVIAPALAFTLRLLTRAAGTASIFFDSLPPDQRGTDLGLMNFVIGITTFIIADLKPENLRLMTTALRDTVTIWALLASPQERLNLLATLERAHAESKGAGVDDDITAISTVIKSVKD